MNNRQPYSDMADAIESLKEVGFTDLTEKRGPRILDIVNSSTIEDVHTFQEGTDPGYESTLYQLHDGENNKYFIALSFGMYLDPEKSDWVDILERKRP